MSATTILAELLLASRGVRADSPDAAAGFRLALGRAPQEPARRRRARHRSARRDRSRAAEPPGSDRRARSAEGGRNAPRARRRDPAAALRGRGRLATPDQAERRSLRARADVAEKVGVLRETADPLGAARQRPRSRAPRPRARPSSSTRTTRTCAPTTSGSSKRRPPGTSSPKTTKRRCASTRISCRKPALLATLAQVHDTKRDDPRRALDAYDRLREIDATELGPLEKMEQLATLLSDWAVLDRVLVAKAELVARGRGAREHLAAQSVKLGATCWTTGRRDRRVRARAELDPESAFTVDCLIELYEARATRRGSWSSTSVASSSPARTTRT